MSIFCLGINHKTAPVEIRERLAFAQSSLEHDLQMIQREIEEITETVILSTCNRVEIFGAADQAEVAMDQLTELLIDHFDVRSQTVDFYRHQSEAAANHLFEVASGLDSMVLGETEIFGQVKKAYSTAHEAGTTGRRLNKLFQQSFTVGKLVRSNSKIQHGSTSVGSVAVDVAEKIFGRLKGCQVMIIGAGEMSRTTAQSLMSRGAQEIIVSNRNYDRAVEMADMLGGEAMRFDDWESALHRVDILISSTSAPHAVIKREAIESGMKKRRGRPIFLIDIAVPRDIDPEIREISNAFVFDIDQLTEIAEEGKNRREEQIIFCRKLIAEYLNEKGIDALKPISPADSQSKKKEEKVGSNRPLTNP